MTKVEVRLCKAMLKFMREAIKERPSLKRPLKPVQSALSELVENDNHA